MKFLTQKLIENSEFSEIDFTLYDEFKVRGGYDRTIIEQGDADVDNHPINIDTMINELQRLKDNGATHVAIDYHVDHIGYEFSSFVIAKSTPAEVKAYKKAEQEQADKQAEINDLVAKIRQIQATM